MVLKGWLHKKGVIREGFYFIINLHISQTIMNANANNEKSYTPLAISFKNIFLCNTFQWHQKLHEADGPQTAEKGISRSEEAPALEKLRDWGRGISEILRDHTRSKNKSNTILA